MSSCMARATWNPTTQVEVHELGSDLYVWVHDTRYMWVPSHKWRSVKSPINGKRWSMKFESRNPGSPCSALGAARQVTCLGQLSPVSPEVPVPEEQQQTVTLRGTPRTAPHPPQVRSPQVPIPGHVASPMLGVVALAGVPALYA